jgi:hypothetical protein
VNPQSRPSREKQRGYDFKCRYNGFTVEDFEALSIKQDHKCLGCAERKPLVVDHDHVTGQVRGLLCHHCNLVLGHAKDNTETLNRLKNYLQG